MPAVVGRRFDTGADAAKLAIADAGPWFRVSDLSAGGGGGGHWCGDRAVLPTRADAAGGHDPRRRRRWANGARGRNPRLESVYDSVLSRRRNRRRRRRAGRTDPVRLSRT